MQLAMNLSISHYLGQNSPHFLSLCFLCKNLPADRAVIPDHDPARLYFSRLDETDVHPVESAAKINRYKASLSLLLSMLAD